MENQYDPEVISRISAIEFRNMLGQFYALSHSIKKSFTKMIFKRYKIDMPDKKSMNAEDLKVEVKNLYKNLIHLSRDWHHDLRPQIKKAFMKNKEVTDPAEIRQLIEKGQYVCREIVATYRLKKYRALKRRYYSDDENSHLNKIFKSFGTQS